MDEAVGHDSDEERGECGHGESGAHGPAYGQQSFFFGLAHEHGVGHLQVVVQAEDGIEHAQRGQRVVSGFDQAQEDEVLALEAGQRRNSGQREQEDQHQHGFDGSARVEAVEVVEFVADHVAVAQRRDHAERAEVHEGVDQQINQDAFDAVRAEFVGSSGDQAEQHVADVRDGRIGQQALGVGLRERGEVRAGHGRDGNEDQHGNPGGAHGEQSARGTGCRSECASSIAHPAAFTATDMNPVMQVGAPS